MIIICMDLEVQAASSQVDKQGHFSLMGRSALKLTFQWVRLPSIL